MNLKIQKRIQKRYPIVVGGICNCQRDFFNHTINITKIVIAYADLYGLAIFTPNPNDAKNEEQSSQQTS